MKFTPKSLSVSCAQKSGEKKCPQTSFFLRVLADFQCQSRGPSMPRPLPTFNGFIGQRKRVGLLQRLVDGARATGSALPPLMFVGPSGCGKTSFARATAVAFGTDLCYLLATAKTRPQEIYETLRQVSFGDILFIDEAHSLVRDAQQALYLALDKHKIPAVGEKGKSGQCLESVAEFTLILATNYPGEVRKSLRSRTTPVEFDTYQQSELKAIAQAAVAENINLTAQAAGLIAKTAQGSPRQVRTRLQNLKLFVPAAREYTINHVRDYLNSEGIDVHGLTTMQRNYLTILANSPKQRCGLDHMASKLGVDPKYIRQEIECYLVELNYVEVLSSHVRQLTPRGWELAKTFPEQKE